MQSLAFCAHTFQIKDTITIFYNFLLARNCENSEKNTFLIGKKQFQFLVPALKNTI